MIISKDKILITGGSGFIGTNLIDLFEKLGYDFINFDKNKPNKVTHTKYWHQGNLLVRENIDEVLNQYQPSIVIHLAARTDCDSDKVEDYFDNTDGTKNLIESIKSYGNLKHVIITSTQYVYKSKDRPFQFEDDDYLHHTAYGQSKVITEELTRNSNLSCAWTIVRPANVWGPWHMRYPNELWKMLDKGYYVHASNSPVIRTYAYVGNVVYQLDSIINSPFDKVNKKTFYLGDLPIDSYLWLNEISKQLRGKSIKRLSSKFFILPALAGDLLKKVGISSPIYSTRFRNMVEDYYAPTNITIHQFGISHPSISENVKETITWIKNEGKSFFPYWLHKY